MWYRTTINEAGLVAHYFFLFFFELVGVARLPKRLVTCFPTGLLPMKSHKSGTSNLYFSYSYPISTLPSKGPSKVLNLEGAQSNTDDARLLNNHRPQGPRIDACSSVVAVCGNSKTVIAQDLRELAPTKFNSCLSLFMLDLIFHSQYISSESAA
jgi:hypothetical protein